MKTTFCKENTKAIDQTVALRDKCSLEKEIIRLTNYCTKLEKTIQILTTGTLTEKATELRFQSLANAYRKETK